MYLPTTTHCPAYRHKPSHTATRTAAHRRAHCLTLPHCCTLLHCRTHTTVLPHDATCCRTLPLLHDNRTLRCVLPYITNNTAAHWRTMAHCRTIHTNPNKFLYIHMDSHKLCVCHMISSSIYCNSHLAVGNSFQFSPSCLAQ